LGLVETLLLAIRSLWSNKLRTGLSVLGIIIGVGSVIVMISVGTSAQNQITSDISSLGSNLIMITPGAAIGRSGQIARDYRNLLTLDLAREIQDAAPAAATVAPLAQADGRLIYGDLNVRTPIMGITPAYADIVNYRVERGRMITEQEMRDSEKSIILGWKIAEKLFGSEDPIGRTIKVGFGDSRIEFTCVGVMEQKGGLFFSNFDDQAYVPVTTLLYRAMRVRVISSYVCQAVSDDLSDAAVAQIERYLAVKTGNPQAFTVMSQKEILDTVNRVTSTMTFLLGAIAGISLLVGGIGIMNIMLVSVTERTREIGIRKSMGAKNRHILLQFIVEAMTLSGSGGLIGILFGWLGGTVITRIAGWPPSYSLLSVLVAIGFSSAVGLFFGIYPAMKAARMDPVEALRYE
jgi:putative ABC transport system permease protein